MFGKLDAIMEHSEEKKRFCGPVMPAQDLNLVACSGVMDHHVEFWGISSHGFYLLLPTATLGVELHGCALTPESHRLYLKH